MSLSKPNVVFSIPSLHDSIALDCRLHYSRKGDKTASSPENKFAVLAHPYAPLGGSYDDPVVSLVGGVLIRQGFTVVTFNFRGAAGSAGHTSWSGKPELGDYVSVIGFMLVLIHHVELSTTHDGSQQSLLLVGGYSYGSMICSALPAMTAIAQIFTSPPPASTEFDISARAINISADVNAFLELQDTIREQGRGRTGLHPLDEHLSPGTHGPMMGGYESQPKHRRHSRDSSQKGIDMEKVKHGLDKTVRRWSHRGSHPPGTVLTEPFPSAQSTIKLPQFARLLVSPVLPPAAGLITMFSTLRFSWKNQNLPSDVDLKQSMPTYALYGSKDSFTSAKKLHLWVEEQHRLNSRFEGCEIDGAGHFWSEPGVAEQLRQKIRQWLGRRSDQYNTGDTSATSEAVRIGESLHHEAYHGEIPSSKEAPRIVKVSNNY